MASSGSTRAGKAGCLKEDTDLIAPQITDFTQARVVYSGPCVMDLV